jgi:hypothetical protein
LLRYRETFRGYKTGFKIRKVGLSIDTVDASKTIVEQRARIEKISLVAFLSQRQEKMRVTVCRRFKKNNTDFYQNSNLHVT